MIKIEICMSEYCKLRLFKWSNILGTISSKNWCPLSPWSALSLWSALCAWSACRHGQHGDTETCRQWFTLPHKSHLEMRNNYLEYFVLYYKKMMTFSTSFEIFVLCCFLMQHCFCMVATVTAVVIASMVGTVSMVITVSMVSTVSMVGTVSMINTVFTLDTF